MDVAVRDPTSFSCSLRRYRVSLTLAQIIISAGNDGHVPPTGYPTILGDPNTKTDFPEFQGNRDDLAKAVDNFMVVAGTDKSGKLALFSQTAPWVTIYAPADDVWVPNDDVNMPYILKSGTSFGK